MPPVLTRDEVRGEGGVRRPLLVFAPPPTTDHAEMTRWCTALVDAIDDATTSGGAVRARVLFDLRDSGELRLTHVWFALGVLRLHEEYMRRKLARSAALLPGDEHGGVARWLAPLCALFLRLYRPVRPFKVATTWDEARAFLAAADDDA